MKSRFEPLNEVVVGKGGVTAGNGAKRKSGLRTRRGHLSWM